MHTVLGACKNLPFWSKNCCPDGTKQQEQQQEQEQEQQQQQQQQQQLSSSHALRERVAPPFGQCLVDRTPGSYDRRSFGCHKQLNLSPDLGKRVESR